MPSPWLRQKSIVIIGGTSGIGLAAARAFIEEGANVIAVGKDEESTQATRLLLKDNFKAITADAIQADTAPHAISLCIKEFGGFDGLYHVAGGSGRKFGDGPLHDLTLEGWNQTLSLNLTSLMLSNQAAIRAFLDRKTAGAILNMGSILGFSPSPKYFVTHAYAAAKSAVIGFSKSIASYYAPHNIRINVLAPSLVDTPMAQRAANDPVIQEFIRTKQPLDGGRIAVPEDLTGAAVYLMSDSARFTTGQVLAVDGGWSVTEGQY